MTPQNIGQIINYLSQQIEYERQEYPYACQSTSWRNEEGILISVEDAETLLWYIDHLTNLLNNDPF